MLNTQRLLARCIRLSNRVRARRKLLHAMEYLHAGQIYRDMR